MDETREFSTLTILSVTTGRLLTTPVGPRDNGIGQLYELLGWMTNDQPFTHQIPRFADECSPWLRRWFPDLAALDAEIDRECDAGNPKPLTESLVSRFGATRMVARIPRDDHTVRNPLEELVEMRGSTDGIVLVVSQ